MRLLRVLAVATGFAVLLSQASAAQDTRQFKDAWFWGVKGGGMLYSSASTTGSAAPLVGAEWLITRTNGGLYVSFDQAFLSTTGGFIDHDTDSTFVRPVSLKNLRRFTMAAMAFPMQSRTLHPYAGAGLVFNQIAGAALLTGSTSSSNYLLAADSIQSKKTAFSPIFLAGVQARLRPMSVFGQVTASPTQEAFFLSNAGSSKFNFALEFGVRYNVGSSIDRAR
ncbi:MAG: hypothetical protein ABJA80_09390 [bacterium]